MRLKSRDKWVPGGFQILIPQAGMKAPFSGSFSDAVRFLHSFRSKNPALCEKHGWSLDIAQIETDVDLYNAQRMVAAGFLNFVEIEGQPPPIQHGDVSVKKKGVVAGGVSAALTGAKIYKEMFAGSQPVSLAEAERRASICEVCPQNKRGGFKDWFVSQTAKALTELVGMMNDMNLRTSKDGNLGKCETCDCPMRAKIWPQLDVILKHMKPDQIKKLDPKCWITNQAAGS